MGHNHIYDLTENQQRSVEAVINKAMYRIDPQFLIDKLTEIIPNHKVSENPVANQVLASLVTIELPKLEKELFTMTGFVLQSKGPHIEVVINEETVKGQVRKKLLLPRELFVEEGLEGVGSPFILSIYLQGGKTITEVKLNKEKDEMGVIPEEVEKLISRIEQEEEKNRRDQKSNG